MNYHHFTFQLWALTAIIKGKVINPNSINVSLSVCLSEKTHTRVRAQTCSVAAILWHISPAQNKMVDTRLQIVHCSGLQRDEITPHRGRNGAFSVHNTQRRLISSTATIIGANKRKRQQREQITLTSIHKHRENHLPQQLIHTYTATCLWAFLP